MQISFVGIRAATLEQTAIKQELAAGHFQQVLRSGNRAGGAIKVYFHIPPIGEAYLKLTLRNCDNAMES